jgi:hypothetical protein
MACYFLLPWDAVGLTGSIWNNSEEKVWTELLSGQCRGCYSHHSVRIVKPRRLPRTAHAPWMITTNLSVGALRWRRECYTGMDIKILNLQREKWVRKECNSTAVGTRVHHRQLVTWTLRHHVKVTRLYFQHNDTGIFFFKVGYVRYDVPCLVK